MRESSPPLHWQERRLVDLAQYLNGYAFKPDDWSLDGTPIIRIEQLNNPRGWYDHFKGWFPEANAIDDGDLIFSWSATLKVVIWKHGKGVLNQHLFKVTPKEGYDKHFIFYVLDFNMDDLGGGSHGSTMKHIKRGELERYKVWAPFLPEQQRIAEILCTVDEAIEQTESLIAKTQQIKAGLMHDLFTRGITPDGKLRPPREEAPDLYKESPLGWIPKEWHTQKIRVFFRRRTERGKVGLPIMSITMTAGLIPREKVDRRVDSKLIPEQHLLVRKGDIAYNMMRMWQGVLGRAPYDCLVSPAYVVMSPTDLLDSRFAEGLLSLPESIAKFKRLSYGVVDDRLRLYARDLERIQLAVPREVREQTAIATRFAAISQELTEHLANRNKLRQLRSGLSHDLLTGRVRVKVTEEIKNLTSTPPGL